MIEAVLICDFEVLPSAASEPVKPVQPDEECDQVDPVLVPVNLQSESHCNCIVHPMRPVCFVNISPHRIEEITVDTEESAGDNSSVVSGDDLAHGHNDSEKNSCDNGIEVDEHSHLIEILDFDDTSSDLDSGEEDTALFPERFPVIGAWCEKIYQQGLAICSWRRAQNLPIKIQVEHEPDNIKDSNAIKFCVFHNNKWHVIGYCGVKKLPKLKRAMLKDEITSITIDSLKRIFAWKEKEFLFCASILIVKHGRWGNDEPMNNYNSTIPIY